MKKMLQILIALAVSACGGGSSSVDNNNTLPLVGSNGTGINVSGSAIKGPLTGATVYAYPIDFNEPNLRPGTPIAQGTTNLQAEIEGLVIPDDVTLPIIIEVDGSAATDLNSGTTPVITTMRTLLTQEVLVMEKPIYVTPLTTIVLELARLNADRNSPPFAGDGMNGISLSEFESVLPIANEMMLASLGFGLDTDANVFTTPALITNNITSDNELINAAHYRLAIEALSALIVALEDDINSNLPNSTDTNTLMMALARDLADGNINGNSFSTPVTELNNATNLTDLLSSDVDMLDIPDTNNPDTGNNYKVSEIEQLMVAQARATGVTNVDLTPLEQGNIMPEPIILEPDSDGDGLYDFEESSIVDVDNDGIVDQEDSSNNDPCLPTAFNSSCPTDTDADGISDFNEGENTDSDSDGLFDYQESLLDDADSDGINNQIDATNNEPCLPSAFNANCTQDTDGDGVSDFNEGEFSDTDSDGKPNYTESALTDADTDGTNDQLDPADSNPCIPNNSTIGCATGIASRPENPDCAAPIINTSADIELTRRFPSLLFTSPVKALLAPNDSAFWYIVEQDGNVKRFANDDSTAQSETYLSIPVTAGGERGLLSITFSPDWPSRKEIYVYYTIDNGGLESRISRLIISDDSILPAIYTEEILLTIDQPFENHNGGDMAFGADGYLYLGLGDGGSGNDPNDDGQDQRTLLGTMIRIDVDGVDFPSPGYNIPSDNPFSANAKCSSASNTSACPEIYAWGLRNPWRWSFDSQTNKLWLGDVGQSAREEIDIIIRGGNYGWRCKEASLTTDLDSAHSNCITGAFINPIHEYSHENGNNSVTGGFVYRGSTIEALHGRYIFADFISGRIWALNGNNETGFQAEQLIDSNHLISSFAQDHNRELYILSYSGGIYQIVEPTNSNSTTTMPNDIFDIGCVTPATTGQPVNGLIPYVPKAPFWSDNAQKNRWIALPDGLTIDANNDQIWSYPNGTVTMKNFKVEDKLIETRFFMRHPNGDWAGYTYEWNEDETQASRVIGGKTRELSHTVSPQTWIYPSEGECLQCHTTAAGRLLGMNTPQLNHDFLYPNSGVTDNQLETFNHIDLFAVDVAEPVTVLPTIADPEDTGESITQRARAYLHTNCASCHQPGGGTPAGMDLRNETELNLMGICNVDPLLGSFGTVDKLIKPGSSSESIVLYRMNRRDNDGMPPIGSNVIDTAGVQLISDWINSLSDCN